MIVEDQQEVVAFLSRPGAYRGSVADDSGGGSGDGSGNGRRAEPSPGPVEIRRTHASLIFLVGDRAFKLKRSVRFPYLDYSTADLRRHFCEAEVEINRRTAPDVYRRVVPVVRRPDGRLALGEEGTPIDWLIEMERLEEDALFDRLAGSGRLDRFAVESLADVIAAFHADAERRPEGGGAAGIARVLDSNRGSFAESDPAILDPSRIRALEERALAVFAGVAPLLDRRRDEGFVRHCHGDLHLRNIVVRSGRAVLFDAIEFDPLLADIDVLYDLAFLVMDLQFRDLGMLASILLNRYLDNTGDAGGLAALPLFLSVRAAIRSHIDAVAAANQASAEERGELADVASRYLDLASAFLVPGAPRLVAIGGLSGTGKSRLARQLAPCLGPAPGARVVRTDSTRKRLAGVALGTRLGPRDYSPETSARVYRAIYDEARLALAAGLPVIADAVFAQPEERAAIAAVAAEAGVPFSGIWLDADPRLMEQRVTGRRNNVSDATPEVVRLQLSYDLGAIDWPRLDSSGAEDGTLRRSLAALGLPAFDQP